MDLVTLVSQVGFPIVMCLLMWKFITSAMDNLRIVVIDVQITMMEIKNVISDIQKSNRHLTDQMNQVITITSNCKAINDTNEVLNRDKVFLYSK